MSTLSSDRKKVSTFIFNVRPNGYTPTDVNHPKKHVYVYIFLRSEESVDTLYEVVDSDGFGAVYFFILG